MGQFQEGLTAKQQGIDTKRLFIYHRENDNRSGHFFRLEEDDDTECPFFSDVQPGGSKRAALFWKFMSYAEESKGTKNIMYPKTAKAAKEEIAKLEKQMDTAIKKRDGAAMLVQQIESALNKLKQL